MKTISGHIYQWVNIQNSFTVTVPNHVTTEQVIAALKAGEEVRGKSGVVYLASWDGFEWGSEEYGDVTEVVVEDVEEGT